MEGKIKKNSKKVGNPGITNWISIKTAFEAGPGDLAAQKARYRFIDKLQSNRESLKNVPDSMPEHVVLKIKGMFESVQSKRVKRIKKKNYNTMKHKKRASHGSLPALQDITNTKRPSSIPIIPMLESNDDIKKNPNNNNDDNHDMVAPILEMIDDDIKNDDNSNNDDMHMVPMLEMVDDDIKNDMVPMETRYYYIDPIIQGLTSYFHGIDDINDGNVDDGNVNDENVDENVDDNTNNNNNIMVDDDIDMYDKQEPTQPSMQAGKPLMTDSTKRRLSLKNKRTWSYGLITAGIIIILFLKLLIWVYYCPPSMVAQSIEFSFMDNSDDLVYDIDDLVYDNIDHLCIISKELYDKLWIPDLFMKRVENDEKGKEFEAQYIKYENEKRYKRQVKARELWTAILQSQIETGTPYMVYKDACNNKSNHTNLGCIKSLILCTEIIEYISPDEAAVCNLELIALPIGIGVQGFNN